MKYLILLAVMVVLVDQAFCGKGYGGYGGGYGGYGAKVEVMEDMVEATVKVMAEDGVVNLDIEDRMGGYGGWGEYGRGGWGGYGGWEEYGRGGYGY